ncbi:MAG TPA: hypothetical protein VF041_09215 [Gemmatimonadaceae bacterium]
MTKRMLHAGLVAGAICVAAGALGAQSLPAMARAKRAATNAVAATNAHTRVMTQDQDSLPAKSEPARRDTRREAHRAAAPVERPGTMTAGGASGHPARPAASHTGGRAAAGNPAGSAAASAPAGHAAGGKAPAGARPSTPTADTTLSVSGRGEEARPTLMRESFTYSVDGRRDPFMSLLESGDLRPMISDLRLVTVVYSAAGRSVAILRDLSTKEQYRVREGQTLGRMRVASIRPKSVTFTLEEYGFSRQEVLALNDTTRARSQ